MASMPQSPVPDELEKLFELIQDAKTTSYFAVAALIYLIYDHILSLDLEIEFIWKRRKSPASYVYIWNRYFTLIITCINTSVILREIPTDIVCQIYTQVPLLLPFGTYAHHDHQFEGVSSTLIVAAVDVILLMRVWLLFGKSRRLLYFLIPLMLVEIGTMFFIAIFTINNANKYVHVGPLLPGCYSFTVPKFFTFYPVPSLIVTFTMFLMTVHNCKTRLGSTFSSRNTMPLVNLFLRDGIYWFLAVVAVNPPQIIIWAVARPTLTEMLIIPSIVVYSIIGSRVLLNIMEMMAVGVVHHQIITTFCADEQFWLCSRDKILYCLGIDVLESGCETPKEPNVPRVRTVVCGGCPGQYWGSLQERPPER
ncbi:hypothetical protein C8R44DRAFT_853061 [Mycena epipterygia]|nr:hypothetical protein C8R44DRAFT_853061 [Mycena epipterygia]